MTTSTIHCSTCKVPFALERGHVEQLRRTRHGFFCPNGHRIHFTGPTKAEREKDELIASLERRVERLKDTIRRLSDHVSEFRKHTCLYPYCRFSHAEKKQVREHMRTCKRRPQREGKVVAIHG